MNKIEYMAMSLPFKLKCQVSFRKEILELDLIKTDYIFGFVGSRYFKNCNPILRPLSDFEKMGFDISDEILVSKLMEGNSIDSMPFYLIKCLVENHFDICGLIESGEAIDYHTLDFVF